MSEETIDENAEETATILVNGEAVSAALIEQELQMLRERYSNEMSWDEMEARREKVESDARENAVERLLLTQKARADIQDVRPEEIEARFVALQHEHGGEEEFGKRFELSDGEVATIKTDLLDGVKLEQYFDVICAAVPRPVEADSRAYYDLNPDEFVVPETVRAAHILQHPDPGEPMEKGYADLLNVRERLLNGEDFDAVANETSRCADDGHDLGYFSRGQMVQAFEDVAFATPVGEISAVFQTEFGYHILTVIDRGEATTRSYEEVRQDIEGLLFDERKNEAIGVVADGLRAVADIQNLVVVEES